MIESIRKLNGALAGIRRAAGRWLPWTRPDRKPQGADGVARLGHRDYVGGQWETIGRLQFDFLVAQGLRPEHYLLDAACGSLRAGVHLIPYLEPEHYLGVDKEESLIEAGMAHELGEKVFASRRPRFVVTADFEFKRFAVQPDFVLIHSLFTHLPPPLIAACLSKLRPCAHFGTRCFVTFFESRTARANPAQPHDHGTFHYTRGEMGHFGRDAGWSMEYVGAWNHPRGQKMVVYRPEGIAN